jgi:hypothetical protein
VETQLDPRIGCSSRPRTVSVARRHVQRAECGRDSDAGEQRRDGRNEEGREHGEAFLSRLTRFPDPYA